MIWYFSQYFLVNGMKAVDVEPMHIHRGKCSYNAPPKSHFSWAKQPTSSRHCTPGFMVHDVMELIVNCEIPRERESGYSFFSVV